MGVRLDCVRADEVVGVCGRMMGVFVVRVVGGGVGWVAGVVNADG